ncbi:MAG TPA: hypothetical protein VLZ74_07355 [Methylocella sp.]|nr:hypothetical protein [Methylocella sp.]
MSVILQSSDPPAEAAAKVLSRLGLGVLFVALPCLGIFWRGAIYVLLPVGGVLILIGGILDASRHGGRRLRGALVTPVGGAALFLTFWASLSLFWTPFPGAASERFLQSAGTTALAVLVTFYLPPKTKAFDLYLLPAGVAAMSAATLALSLFGSAWFLGSFEFDETLFERSMITAIVLVWPALGALSFREHWISAALLVVLVAAVALAGFAQIALLATGAGAFTFALAMSGPARTARFLAWIFGLLIFFAPALPLLYAVALRLTGFEAGSGSAPMLIWRDLIVSQWPRLVTGHGFDFVHQGLSFGYLPERAPRSLLFVVWYDLGLAGAAGLGLLVVYAFRNAGALPAKAAPALLAGLVAILTIAILGIATAQIWWVTLLDCDIIAFALLLKGIDKMQRPDAEAIRALKAETPQEEWQINESVVKGSAAMF